MKYRTQITHVNTQNMVG